MPAERIINDVTKKNPSLGFAILLVLQYYSKERFKFHKNEFFFMTIHPS